MSGPPVCPHGIAMDLTFTQGRFIDGRRQALIGLAIERLLDFFGTKTVAAAIRALPISK